MRRKVSYDLYRRKLEKLLSGCSVSEFNATVWGIEAVTRDEIYNLRPGFTYPKEMRGAKIGTDFYIPPWKLEDLYNFFAAVRPNVSTTRRLNPLPSESWLSVVQLFSKLQNSESGQDLERSHIFDELPKLAHKQFDWQSGYLSAPQFYRNLFVYGGPRSLAAFESAYGLSVQTFVKIGLATRAMFHKFENIAEHPDTSELQISASDFQTFLRMTTVHETELHSKAREVHAGSEHTSYRPSLLRRFPLIRTQLPNGRKVIQCPIVDTLILRVTEGLFYDVIEVDNDKSLRKEVGDQFQSYCADLLISNFGADNVMGEFKYSRNAKPLDSSDILVGTNNQIQVICECKARKMPLAARFGSGGADLAKDGMEEIGKGIAQIWTFVQHTRLDPSICTRQLSEDPIGLLLTWEPWFVMAPLARVESAFDLAEKWLRKKGIEIQAANKIPIAFTSIRDLEQACRFVTLDEFKLVLKEASLHKYRGYHLNSVRAEMIPNASVSREYELRHRIKDILPWWHVDLS